MNQEPCSRGQGIPALKGWEEVKRLVALPARGRLDFAAT